MQMDLGQKELFKCDNFGFGPGFSVVRSSMLVRLPCHVLICLADASRKLKQARNIPKEVNNTSIETNILIVIFEAIQTKIFLVLLLLKLLC